MLKILLTWFFVGYFSFIFDLCLRFWETAPIIEEKSTPIYITKELKDDGTF